MIVVVELVDEGVFDILDGDLEPIETDLSREDTTIWLEENEPDEVFFEEYGIDSSYSYSAEEAIALINDED